MGFLIHWAIVAAALWVAAYLIPGVVVRSVPALLVAALVLGLVNALVRPVLTILTLPMIASSFAFYPTVVQLARDAKEDFVAATYAPQVLNLRQNVQMQVQQSLTQIDAIPNLAELATRVSPRDEVLTDQAFQVWQTTALATYPITSSIELYGPDGKLVRKS